MLAERNRYARLQSISGVGATIKTSAGRYLHVLVAITFLYSRRERETRRNRYKKIASLVNAEPHMCACGYVDPESE